MEEEEVKNGLKINTWGKMITLPASFWVDNRFEHKGYTVFRQSIPDKGEFIGTILIGFGKTQVFEDILQNYISDTNLFHEGVTNYYKSYKLPRHLTFSKAYNTHFVKVKKLRGFIV